MENKDNSGVLFANKKTKDNQPDFRGTVKVNGVDLDISGWKKTSKNGNEYFSLSFQKPFNREQENALHGREEQKKQVLTDEADDLPF